MEWFAACVALLCAGFAGWFAWLATDSAENARHSEHRLSIMRGQVAGLEASLVALDDKHKRLAGRVYADEYWRGQTQPQLVPDDQPRAAMGEPCVNWTTAQRDGPGSPAAGCECEYCNARREDRARRRASMRSGVKT